MKRIKAFAHASSANLGPGFDIMGLALSAFGDIVELEEDPFTSKISIFSNNLPLEIENNTAGLAIKKVLESKKIRMGLKLKITKGVPVGMGLGSSGASAAAAVTAINELLGLELSLHEMINFAMQGETAAAGEPHADNVAPSLIGGLVALTSIDPMDFIILKLNPDISIKLILPDVKIKNKTIIARSVVPEEIKMRDHVKNAMNILGLINSFEFGNIGKLKKYMVDQIVELKRSSIYPFLGEIRNISQKYEDVSIALSGAGPSIIVFHNIGHEPSDFINEALDIFNLRGIKCQIVKSEVGGGSRVIED